MFVLVAMMGLTAWAQSEYPKFEAAADFSLVAFNPSKAFTTSHNLFGGGGSITYNVTKFIGVRADFQGYGSQTNTFFIPPGTTVSTSRGVLTLPTGTFNVNGNLFTYLFGPQIKYRASNFEPFGEVLFGGAHSNVYTNLLNQAGLVIGVTPGNNAFAMLVGGGVDIKVSHSIALRPAEIDYLLTRFGSNITGNTSNQNNFHYAAGVVFRFGGS